MRWRSRLGALLAATAIAGQVWAQEPGRTVRNDHALMEAYSGALKALDERHLGPTPYWHPDEYGFAWYTTRPSFGGDRDIVSFQSGRAGRDAPLKFQARRVRFRAEDVVRAVETVAAQGSGSSNVAAVLARVPVERAIALEASCPTLKPLLAELETLPLPSIDIEGINDDKPERFFAMADGTGVTLHFGRLAAHGRLTLHNNYGPAHDWVMRFEAATASCWRPDTAS